VPRLFIAKRPIDPPTELLWCRFVRRARCSASYDI
jgi:hypothetical protein